jgi:hypothetical protein
VPWGGGGRGGGRAPPHDPLLGLEDLSVPQLREAWGRLLSEQVPALRTAELLRLALAYRLQAAQHGDLPPKTRRRIAELARQFAADRDYTPTRGPNLKPGSSIVKAYRGERYEVRVLESGFACGGRIFRSLSEVARHITGTKWNGHVFFGLKARS